MKIFHIFQIYYDWKLKHCVVHYRFNLFLKFIVRFQYKWTATVPGTNWYHSHVAFQRGDGLLGMYIVRLPPDEETHVKSYDYDLTDHHIVAQEWFHGVSSRIS